MSIKTDIPSVWKSILLKLGFSSSDDIETIRSKSSTVSILDEIVSNILKSGVSNSLEHKMLMEEIEKPIESLVTLNNEIYYGSDKERFEMIRKIMPDATIIKTHQELKNNYILDDWTHAKDAEEKSSLWIKNNIIVCENKHNGKKAFGMALPYLDMSSILSAEEYFFIGNEVIHYYSQDSDIMSLIVGEEKDDVTQSESRVKSLLELMERKNIDDLHIKLASATSYEITGRITSKAESISKGRPLNVKVINDIIDEFIEEAQQDPYTKKPEIRGLIRERVSNSKGAKIDRTFRIHLGQQSFAPIVGNTLSVRRFMCYEQLKALSLKKMGYTGKAYAILKEVIESVREGSIIVSGATNSGKSTLLYKIVDELIDEGERIVTIENPVEMPIPGLVQIDRKKTEDADESLQMSLVGAMSFLLSHDPDVSLINEVRDEEEIKAFIEMALQGHLSATTMHSHTVRGAILRILKAIPKEYAYDAFKLIINPSLVDLKCQNCNGTGRDASEKGDDKLCPICEGRGVKGKCAIPEILYFKKTPDPEKDDVLDFDKLVKDGVAIYLPKIDFAKELAEMGLLTDKDYKKYIQGSRL
jgi:type II secretory ATPase GspE/PulE/Tfp pilus assembly ATPase PilB-like protein